MVTFGGNPERFGMRVWWWWLGRRGEGKLEGRGHKATEIRGQANAMSLCGECWVGREGGIVEVLLWCT